MSAQMNRNSTILIVDDDETVRLVVCLILNKKGFTVIEAGDSAAALDMVARRKVDLLLSDVIMPGQNGPDLYRDILKIQPGLKVLFMSGHPGRIIGQHADVINKSNFIQKPFSVPELIEKITSAIFCQNHVTKNIELSLHTSHSFG